MKIGLVKHYTSLKDTYHTPNACQEALQNSFKEKWKNLMQSKAESDSDSRLGTYFRINPELQRWIPSPQSILEIERKLVTRYRIGSHSLNIELGRYSNINRENRLCTCGRDVQTIWHIFTMCPLTEGIVDTNYHSLNDIFSDNSIHEHLPKLSKALRIPIGRI